jgi:hypothetical protein
MPKTFAAQLQDFENLTEDKMRRVLRQSVQDVIQDAQTPVSQGGSMPVLDGFLRNSLATELNGSGVAQGADSFILTIAQMEPGDMLRAGWTAEYARARHYRPEDYGQGGGMWRDKAAAKWQDTVARNAKAVK